MHALEIVWNPSKGIDLGFFTIHYYSLMWIVAFLLGFQIMKRIYKNENQTDESLDSLFIYSVIGIMLGARLGHVIFYQSELITQDFFSIFLPFRFNPEFEFTGFQGLASHGAAIGMILSMYLYNKKVLKKSVIWILDRVVIPVALGAIFVRIGNFINSEIIGKPTGSDFGVVFSKLGEDFARHPAQLYEATCYVFVFLILFFIYWKTKKREQQGFLFGLFLVLLWTVRFFVEFVKEAQNIERAEWSLNTGQLLSIPFILIGLYFMFVYKPKHKLS
ncbi:prolipoprotein diacylglyceryl transferase [Ichthyenterobacterium magnum]|uniref:Phosphatidylglycerol--prolipoprotein diacylglyceryl transferase n=1 Tax=Ichthyenterobacterium magnum TaxID=1230530 RepID=A0A420DFA5_9FLAO|nr:prolipoprotein diacylglyceryl transferase [Ichthyenterobacterium magnum]RKE90876.1 prolipoprotein diacylglyceryl transferase [Ichthyenterobacterium magnum]